MSTHERTTPTTGTPPRAVTTLAQAMQGRRGLDYFPDDCCATCGAMVYYDGRRYQQDHDTAKHGLTVTNEQGPRKLSEGGAATLAHIIDKAVANAHNRARRSTGERDDD